MTSLRGAFFLMSGIESASVLVSHDLERMIGNEEIVRQLALIRRVDVQQQDMIGLLVPPEETVLDIAIAYEQTVVDLTANLAQNVPDNYFRQVLDFALLEDLDHLFRFGCLLQVLEGKDPRGITQGYTEIKPGRPSAIQHRHPSISPCANITIKIRRESKRK